jgi:hypothetical protein
MAARLIWPLNGQNIAMQKEQLHSRRAPGHVLFGAAADVA